MLIDPYLVHYTVDWLGVTTNLSQLEIEQPTEYYRGKALALAIATMPDEAILPTMAIYTRNGWAYRTASGTVIVSRLGDKYLYRQFSGSSAHIAITKHKAIIGHHEWYSIARIDIAATYQLSRNELDLHRSAIAVERQIAAIYHHLQTVSIKGKRPYLSIVTSTDASGLTGSTVYIGKRGNQRMIRVYNKSAESAVGNHPLLRIEIEYRNDLADQAYSAITNGTVPLADIVNGELARYHIVVANSRQTNGRLVKSTDPDRNTEQWIANIVAPALRKYAGRYGKDKLLSLLNLDEIPNDRVDA